ncbi:MFS transporter [Streptomyces sp. NPDC019937]|uniref:MFS transporter n=1 Tax=Streptomyces sp. NPDC019937 TaxID=3154787 RepID=UPI0033D2A55A
MTDHAVRRRRTALFILFLIPGLALSSWVTRTPDVRDALHASTSEMGLVLFGLSAGAMIGVLGSGRLVARLGTRPVIGAGTLLMVLSLGVMGCGALATSAPFVTAGLFLFGVGMGAGDVAVNVDGADIEKISGRTLLPTIHGFFSLGTVIGACLGILCTAVRFPVHWHLFAVVVATAALAVYACRAIPAGIGRTAAAADRDAASASPVWKDRRLLLIGGVILALALAEGTANDWLPLLMVDDHGLDASLGSAVFAGFAAAMTVGRIGGGLVVDRIGRARTLRISALSAALGLAVVIFVDSPVLVVPAVLLWGLGTSLGFPVALSAAGDSGPDSAARVGLAATIGYIAFLVGPPGLGFLGDHYGLSTAMIVVLGIIVIAVFLTPAAGAQHTQPVRSHETAPPTPPRTPR